MDDGFAITIVSILFAAFGIVIGFHFGEEAGGRCETPAVYGGANVATVAAGSIAFLIVFQTGFVVLGMLVVGLIAGGIAGLRFGYGDSIGPWKLVDHLITPAGRSRNKERARRRHEQQASAHAPKKSTHSSTAAQASSTTFSSGRSEAPQHDQASHGKKEA